MKKLINYFHLLLVGLLLFSSCTQDARGRYQDPEQVSSTQTAYLEIEGEPDTQELRIAEIVNPTTGESIEMAMADALDLNIRVAVRRGTGTPVYQTLRFTKIRGKKKVIYKGNIQIPSGGSGAYQMVAVVLGEVGGRTFATVPQNNPNLVHCEDGRLEHIHQINAQRGQVTYSIPYVSNWQTINVSKDGRRIAPFTLHFRPQCTLMRVRLTNATDRPQTIKAIKLSGNAITTRWGYNLAANLDAGNLKFGVSKSTNFEPKEFNLPQPITLQPNQKSAWYYIWGMPNKSPKDVFTGFLAKTSDNEYIYAFGSDRPIELGNVPIELNLRGSYVSGDFDGFGNQGYQPDGGPVGKAIGSDFPNGRLPLEYVAHSNLAETGNAFALIEMTGTGYFSAKEALRIFEAGHITVDGKRYHLPSKEEFNGIFPDDLIGHTNSKPDQNGNYRDRITDVVVGGKRFYCVLDFSRHNVIDGSQILYYLLFKGGDGRNLVAMRYQIRGSIVKGSRDARLLVTSRYIGVKGLAGRNQRDLINVIKQESFWSKNNEHDVSATFFVTGMKREGISGPHGSLGIYLTSTRSILVSKSTYPTLDAAGYVILRHNDYLYPHTNNFSYNLLIDPEAPVRDRNPNIGIERLDKYAIRPFRSF